MSTLTAEQIGMVAWNAGFGRDAPTLARAIAVALAESGGNPRAHNGNAGTGDNSYGLWQINMLGAMGPARRKVFGLTSNEELFDPQKNANAAWGISNKGRNWTPWSVFKSGAYMRHMPVAEAAAKKVIAQAGKNREGFIFKVPGVAGVADTVDAIGEARDQAAGAFDVGGAIQNGLHSLSQSLFKMGLNFGVVLVAAILLILGVVILLRNPLKKAAKGTANVAGAVVPGGALAKGAGKVAKVL